MLSVVHISFLYSQGGWNPIRPYAYAISELRLAGLMVTGIAKLRQAAIVSLKIAG